MNKSEIADNVPLSSSGDALLPRAEVAKMLKVSKGYLAQWATRNIGPRYELHGRRVLYRLGDVLAFLEASERLMASQPPRERRPGRRPRFAFARVKRIRRLAR
jgi:hypothetical protein